MSIIKHVFCTLVELSKTVRINGEPKELTYLNSLEFSEDVLAECIDPKIKNSFCHWARCSYYNDCGYQQPAEKTEKTGNNDIATAKSVLKLIDLKGVYRRDLLSAVHVCCAWICCCYSLACFCSWRQKKRGTTESFLMMREVKDIGICSTKRKWICQDQKKNDQGYHL